MLIHSRLPENARTARSLHISRTPPLAGVSYPRRIRGTMVRSARSRARSPRGPRSRNCVGRRHTARTPSPLGRRFFLPGEITPLDRLGRRSRGRDVNLPFSRTRCAIAPCADAESVDMTNTLERTNLLAHARSIVDGAKNADRDLTSTEVEQVEADIAKIKALDAGSKSGDLVRRVMSLVGPARDPEQGSQLFSEDAKQGLVRAAKTRTAYRTEVDAKAALTTGGMLPTAGTGVSPGLYPTGAFPLSSLFGSEAAPGPVIRYYRMTA